MPYIKQELRNDVYDQNTAATSGELNYLITRCLIEYIERHGKTYEVFNDVIGALEGAKLEFYRRIVIPYEDKKKKENGDVYE